MKRLQTARFYRQQGMSLIELMIGMVVGLIILFGIIQTMMVSKSASQTQQSMSAIAENARFAFEFMNRDLRMAGLNWSFTGETVKELDEDGDVVVDEDGNSYSYSYIDSITNGFAVRYQYEDKASSEKINVHIEYAFDDDGKQLIYSNTQTLDSNGNLFKQLGNNDVLVDGISGMTVEYGVWEAGAASPEGSIQFSDSIGALSDNRFVVAVRITLTFIDSTNEGLELDLNDNASSISTTISLRNLVLKAREKIREAEEDAA